MSTCNRNMTFEECELSILRMAVDKAESKIGREQVNSQEVKDIIEIVEKFIKDRQLICYGGTAINNILPKSDQFYNREIELPDYDFFSKTPLDDAKKLADIYLSNGFDNVEAKAGVHFGTYKVYVNYMPVADITLLTKEIFDNMKTESLKFAGILYAPPNFLRMSMYLELSRPAGDVSRWEKVLKRLAILNKHYPITNISCSNVDFQRKLEQSDGDQIFNVIQDTLIGQSVIFFGGYAISQYSKYMPKKFQSKVKKYADFDVISIEPKKTCDILIERLNDIHVNNTNIIEHNPVGEIIPKHYEIKIGNDTVAFVYEPLGCHNYNVISIGNYNVKIATIDTMLSFYLAFLYSDKPHFKNFTDRIICIANFLFDVQEKNRLKQKGVLRRFSINCYGHQHSLEEIRDLKSKKYIELKNKKSDKEFEIWFLNYKPSNKSKKSLKSNKDNKKQINKKKTNKKQVNKKKTNKKQNKKKKTIKRIKKLFNPY